MKINQLFEYAILLCSVLYSTYVVNSYLQTQLQEIYYSLPLAIVMVSSAHFYLVAGVNEIINNFSVNRKIIAGLILSSFVIFMEFSTLPHLAEANMVDDTELNLFKENLQKNRKRLEELGTSRHYAKVEMRRQIASDNTILMDQIKMAETVLEKERNIAKTRSNQFKAFSIILLCLVMLTCDFDKGFIQEESTFSQRKTKVLDKEFVQEKVKDLPNAYQHLNAEERIAVASKYIQKHPKATQRQLSTMFKLNISQVSLARRNAINKTDLQQIGFDFN